MRADTRAVERPAIECLRCGKQHRLVQSPWRRLQGSECPRCGYLGWAEVKDLTEPVRKALRDRPVELRRLRVVT